MLKIKDNVDLKELEKYGFYHFKKEKAYSNENIIKYSLSTDISTETRKITLNNEYFEEDDLDTLYDLIKDGLVEKVEQE